MSELRCPTDGEPLTSIEDQGSTGLVCPNEHRYPVVDGIPRFVDEAEYVSSFGHQWNRWSATQLDSQNSTSIFHDRFARFFGEPSLLAGLTVLDAGCGAGAFVEQVAPHAKHVVGFDLSQAVVAAAANSRRFGNVEIVQADIYRPPVAAAGFDFVYCIGVLQHTPDPAAAFASLARLVKPGGRLAVWVYEGRWWEPVRPRHLLRHYTTRLSDERGRQFIERFTPRALRLRRRLGELPGPAAKLRKAIPVNDVRDYGYPVDDLSDEQVEEWCTMDTHDMLITKYDQPQTPRQIASWYRDNGFEPPTRSAAESVAMVGVKRN